ncbi:ethylene-responsive transcription factor ERF013-like [Aegilops tauschii subsp. strangulata]|uniref:ethylene-responsive transcription factor ERF013-like n=1 Tax=Aegilops tauschii subsp. strangulata TaxID=200361 RepID=UPI003CC85C09
MPSRPRSSSGYRGVRLRPSSVYYVEIRSGDTRLGLGTFETTQAARAYDAVAWHLGRPRSQMSFIDVRTRDQAKNFLQASIGRTRWILPRLVKRYSSALNFTAPSKATNLLHALKRYFGLQNIFKTPRYRTPIRDALKKYMSRMKHETDRNQ